LLALSARATQLAASKERHCASAGKPDGYGRPLVRCPDAARELGAKYNLSIKIDWRTPNEEDSQKQAEAIEQLVLAGAEGIAVSCSDANKLTDAINSAVNNGVHSAAAGAAAAGAAAAGEMDSRMRAAADVTSFSSANGARVPMAHHRVAYSRTGKTVEIRHNDTLQVCQVVCNGTGDDRSCMTYVPFERHHRDRPACLR